MPVYGMSHEPLIRISVMINKHRISVTGSTVNIMHDNVFKALQHPINKSATPAMTDTNGEIKAILGLVENVPLTCEAVVTHADLFVAKNVPFDLLLGRSWQKNNYIHR
jgi:hypothetical protein